MTTTEVIKQAGVFLSLMMIWGILYKVLYLHRFRRLSWKWNDYLKDLFSFAGRVLMITLILFARTLLAILCLIVIFVSTGLDEIMQRYGHIVAYIMIFMQIKYFFYAAVRKCILGETIKECVHRNLRELFKHPVFYFCLGFELLILTEKILKEPLFLIHSFLYFCLTTISAVLQYKMIFESEDSSHSIESI